MPGVDRPVTQLSTPVGQEKAWSRRGQPMTSMGFGGDETLFHLPTTPGGFRVIVADVPWHFKSNSKANPGRNAMRHYDCMSLEEIAAMPVANVAADDAALFFWITSPFLAIGAHIPIMRAWGFKPSGFAFTWVKLNKHAGGLFTMPEDYFVGTGFTTRKNAEFCLLGKRGRSVRRDASVRELIVSPVRAHSQKPEEFFERVERYSEGPYLELFARQRRRGWTAFGNELDRFSKEDLACRPSN